MNAIEETRIQLYFKISIIVKGFLSFAEVLGGVLILIIPPAAITGWIISASQNELVEEPGDFIASHSLQLAQHFSITSGTIIAIYLLTRGLIKLGLVIALLKNQLWAYPASFIVLGLFILYQAYEFGIGHSLLIATITIFDLIVVYLIWREYVIIKQRTLR